VTLDQAGCTAENGFFADGVCIMNKDSTECASKGFIYEARLLHMLRLKNFRIVFPKSSMNVPVDQPKQF
jgi:hypothetical protein